MQYFDFLTAVFASRASLYFKVCVAAVRHKKQCKGKQILDMTTYSYCGLATNYCAVIVVFFYPHLLTALLLPLGMFLLYFIYCAVETLSILYLLLTALHKLQHAPSSLIMSPAVLF